MAKVAIRRVLGSTLALFMAGWLVGCPLQPQPVDMSLLSGDPCAPPCWQHITPGVTSTVEALAQLMRSPFVKKNSLSGVSDEMIEELGIRVTYSSWESAAGPWDKYFQITRNYIYFHNDTVLWIKVFLEYELTAGQVVEKYGVPKGIFFTPGPHGEKHISLYYPHQGLSLEVLSPRISPQEWERKVVIISEDLKITKAIYFIPDSTEGEWFVRRWHTLGKMPLVQWRGFGEYKLDWFLEP